MGLRHARLRESGLRLTRLEESRLRESRLREPGLRLTMGLPWLRLSWQLHQSLGNLHSAQSLLHGEGGDSSGWVDNSKVIGSQGIELHLLIVLELTRNKKEKRKLGQGSGQENG